MNKLTFLKQSSLDRLQTNINANQHRYSENTPWLNSYFSGSSWLMESNVVQAPPFQLHMPISKTELCDLENTRVAALRTSK
jgi:hypothetical protein